MSAPVTRTYTRAGDGTRLAFSWKDGPATARLVLIHSLAMDHSFFLSTIDALGDSAAVLTLDCRGHGASDKSLGPYTVELFANDVTSVMDAAGWPSAIVAGASMGGSVALAFAAHHQQRCRGLGLFDTTAWYGPDAPKQWAERAEKALAEGLDSLVPFQKTRWFGDCFREAHPDIVEKCVAIFLNNERRAYADTCRMLGNFDLRSALPNIKIPTRIVVGEEDYATPLAMAKVLHEGISGSSLTVIESARHLTPLEYPERIAAELQHLIKAQIP